MSLTRIGVVSTDTVAVCVPTAVVSMTLPSFFLLHAASATENTSALTRAAARAVVRINSLLSDFWNGELQSGVDEIRIGNLVGVCSVNLLPFPGVAVEVPGDLAEAVAALDGVGLLARWSGSRAAASYVGEIRRSA